MNYGQMVLFVQERAELPSRIEADQAVRATLRVLGERMAAGADQDVAFQLPAPLATEVPEQRRGECFGVDEFYSRVSRESGTDEDVARRAARAVTAALRQTLPRPEFDLLRSQLSDDYADLLSAEA